MWTKDEIRTLVEIWESSTLEEISEKMGVDIPRIKALAARLRKFGWPLAQKHKRGVSGNLIREVAAELGISLNN